MKGMTIIVKSVSSWVKMLVLLFGIYVTIFGHLTPGGGFAGGVILASSYILLMLAFGREYAEENLSLVITSKLDCVGALLFAAIALSGFFYGAAAFFYNFAHQEIQAGKVGSLDLVSAGTIPLSNVAICLKVGASLFMIVLILSVFRADSSAGKREVS
jgi:multicomponent Na+:H+ antiporter subunit B